MTLVPAPANLGGMTILRTCEQCGRVRRSYRDPVHVWRCIACGGKC